MFKRPIYFKNYSQYNQKRSKKLFNQNLHELNGELSEKGECSLQHVSKNQLLIREIIITFRQNVYCLNIKMKRNGNNTNYIFVYNLF